MRAALDVLDGLPLIMEQRDCSPWNILLNEASEIQVLDWESAESNGLPALDLVYFLTYLSFFSDGAMESKDFLAAYSNALDPDSFTGRINKECLDIYFTRNNLNPSFLSSLRLLTWLVHSRHEYRRLREDAGGEPTEAALRASMFSQLVREEIRLYHGE